MKLSTIATHLGVPYHGPDLAFSRLSIDSRTIEPGELFVAISGDRFDGHDYVAQAAEKGALACVLEREVATTIPCLIVNDSCQALGTIANLKRQDFTGKVAAITGSCGKTTVKGLLRGICEHAGSTVATRGNYNNHIGVPLTLMRLEDQQYAVIEAGTSGPNEIGYLTNLIEPDVAVVNNVNPAHLEGFSDLQAIAQEKASIYEGLGPDSYAVVNLDDRFAPYFLTKNQKRKIIGFSAQSSKTPSVGLVHFVSARAAKIDTHGKLCFDLLIDGHAYPVCLGVVGKHNIANALAAAACALGMGIAISSIQQGLLSYTGDKGRMQRLHRPDGGIVIDDTYNANPASMKAAIDYISRFPRPWLVCGDMAELGDYSSEGHSEIGAYAAEKGIERVYVIGHYAADVAAGFGEQAHQFTDKRTLEASLQQDINAQDVNADVALLIKGSRSAAMEDIVAVITKDKRGTQQC